MLKKLLQLSLIILATFSFALTTQAADLTGYAWSSNIGWISMKGPNYGVTLNGNQFGGYAWSHNIGWVNFNNTNLTGFAKALAASVTSGWDGQIKLGNGTYGVTNNGNYLSGYAWGDEVVGWVKFCNSGGPNVGYCVKMPALSASCSANVSGNDVTLTAGTVTGGSGTYDYNWSITGQQPIIDHDSSVEITLPDGSYTAELEVVDRNDSNKTVTVFCDPAPFTIGTVDDFTPPEVTPHTSNERLEINSQPLSSPAISSAATFDIDSNSDTNGFELYVSEISPISGGPDISGQLECRWTEGTSSGIFGPCNAVRHNWANSTTGSVKLNIRVNRSTAALKDNSPYRVVVRIDGYTDTGIAIFDYRVGTVNPI